jgi:hypothetical protein
MMDEHSDEHMSEVYEVGFGKPPKSGQWTKGQSGNLKGRPKTRTDLIKDAAAILSEPVIARMPGGKTVKLEGYEASYLALCWKGLKGNVPSLIEAIEIMLDVQPAVDAKENDEELMREQVLAKFEKMGVIVGAEKAE